VLAERGQFQSDRASRGRRGTKRCPRHVVRTMRRTRSDERSIGEFALFLQKRRRILAYKQNRPRRGCAPAAYIVPFADCVGMLYE